MKTNIGDINNLAFRKEKSDYNFVQWIAGFAIVMIIILLANFLPIIFN